MPHTKSTPNGWSDWLLGGKTNWKKMQRCKTVFQKKIRILVEALRAVQKMHRGSLSLWTVFPRCFLSSHHDLGPSALGGFEECQIVVIFHGKQQLTSPPGSRATTFKLLDDQTRLRTGWITDTPKSVLYDSWAQPHFRPKLHITARACSYFST